MKGKRKIIDRVPPVWSAILSAIHQHVPWGNNTLFKETKPEAPREESTGI